MAQLTRTKIAAFAACVAVPATSACTTYLTSRADPALAGEVASVGIPYRLPAAQFSVAVSWTIKKCLPATAPGGEGKVEYSASAAFTSATIEGESRVIDYKELTNAFKSGEIKVEYHDRTMLVKSINAAIEGHEAEAVGAGVKLGGNIGRLLLGLPAPAVAGGQKRDQPPTPCLDGTLDMVEALDQTSARIKAIPPASKKLEDRMAVLRARVVGGKLSPADETELGTLQKDADALATQLTQLTESANRLKASLTYSTSFKFPLDPVTRAAKVPADDEKLRNWLGGLLKPSAVDKTPLAQFEVSASLSPLVPTATCPAGKTCSNASSAKGFVFRQPVEATLAVAVPLDLKQSSETVLVSETVSVPQFGRLRILELRSRWGEKNTLSATFASDGRLATAEYKALKAPGVDALKASNDAVVALVALAGEIEAKEKADKAALESDAAAARKAELDPLTHQIALMEAQAKLDKLQQPTAPDVETLEAQLAILRLQKEKSDLEAAIKKNMGP